MIFAVNTDLNLARKKQSHTIFVKEYESSCSSNIIPKIELIVRARYMENRFVTSKLAQMQHCMKNSWFQKSIFIFLKENIFFFFFFAVSG